MRVATSPRSDWRLSALVSATSPARRRLALVLGLAVLVGVLTSVPAGGPREAALIVDFPVFASLTPDDTFYIDQWGLRGPNGVDAPPAWDVTLGDRNVLVAVVDTGVWWTHNDILGNIWTNTDGTHGYDFIDSDTNPMDEDVAGGTFHGTGVAGVIAALTNNRNDIAGAAQVSVMALRALGPNGEGSSYNTSQAIRWAADHGADVINLSLGTNGTFGGPTDLQLAIDYAWRRGALIVAAAGNSGASQLDFPARLPNVVSVAALDEDGRRASYSNYGTGLDISAPGTRILTLTSNHQIHYLSGTSLAAPFVTAAAALLLSVEPNLTNIDLWNILNATAEPIGSGYNTNYGWGEVNYWNALNALDRPFISVNNFPSTVSQSASFGIGWTIFGPAGLVVTDTHVIWGASSGALGNATAAQSGMTRDSFTAPGLSIPSGASSLYFKVVATVNGTTYESQELSVGASTLPEFVQALYDLLASNLLYLAVFVLALAAIVAFIPQRRARRRRAYYTRSYARPAVRAYAPPPAPPAVRQFQPQGPPVVVDVPHPRRTPGYYEPPSQASPVSPVRSTASPAPGARIAAPAPSAPAKKVCPSCGMAVNADNLFCFFCGHPFR